METKETVPIVGSRAISEIAWDPETDTLEVTFTSGNIYTFDNVPREDWERFKAARSKGTFYHQVIKPTYGL